jgi:ribosome recycling factor
VFERNLAINQKDLDGVDVCKDRAQRTVAKMKEGTDALRLYKNTCRLMEGLKVKSYPKLVPVLEISELATVQRNGTIIRTTGPP